MQAQAAVAAAGADETAKAEAMIAVEVPVLLFEYENMLMGVTRHCHDASS